MFKTFGTTWGVISLKVYPFTCLQYPRGFIAHFYDVSEHISPIMAWGFLGPDGPLKDMCHVFKVRHRHFLQSETWLHFPATFVTVVGKNMKIPLFTWKY